jgi:hypothetical protein
MTGSKKRRTPASSKPDWSPPRRPCQAHVDSRG